MYIYSKILENNLLYKFIKKKEIENEMHSDSETGEKVPAATSNSAPNETNNNRRKSSSVNFVNYHFLDKKEKQIIVEEQEKEQEEANKLVNQIIPDIQNTIELKKDLINANPNKMDENENDEEANNKLKDLNLNSGTKELLNKYRRESVNIPYGQSFFTPDGPATSTFETKEIKSNSLPRRISNIIPRRNSSAAETNSVRFKVDSNRRKSTAAFVNFHFLKKDEKKIDTNNVSSKLYFLKFFFEFCLNIKF